MTRPMPAIARSILSLTGTSRSGKSRTAACILASAIASCSIPTASAVVWNGTDHPERGVTSSTGLTDEPGYFANVAVINNSFNSTRGTATYLGNGWIITARHVVQGTSYSNIAPAGSLSFNGIAGALVIPVPDSAEIALVKLQTSPALTAIPSANVYTGSAEGNTIAQLGGFGYWGAIDGTPNTSAVFHRAYNIAFLSGSFVNITTDGESRLSTNGLLEGGGMPGDSGSPLFILDAPDSSLSDWSQYKLAGILATSQGGGWNSVTSYARVRNYGQLVKDIAYGSGKTYNWARGIAGNFSWNNSTLNGDVTNGNNWNSSLSPTFPGGPGDIANAGAGAGANNQTINLDQNVTIGELVLGTTNNGSGTQSIGAGGGFALTFDNLSAPGMILHTPAGKADVVATPVVIAGSGSLLIANPSSTMLTISGAITSGKTSGTQGVGQTSGTVAISGPISNGSTGGTVAVNVSGGTLILSGSNSYTGGTTLDDGTLSLGNANALGTSGAITFGGGTLQFSAANQGDYSARFSAAANQAFNFDTNGQNVTLAASLVSSGGTLTKTGTGRLTLLGAANFDGDTNIQNGSLNVSSISNSPHINFGAGANTGALVYTGPGQTTSAIINLGAGLGTGGGLIEQAGSGVLKFTGANTATGGQKHTLTLQGSTLGSGEIAGAIVDNSATNNTSVVKNGSGTWRLSGANSYTGTTTITGGTLFVSGAAVNPLVNNTAGTIINGGLVQFDHTGGSSPQSTVVPLLAAQVANNFHSGRFRTSLPTDFKKSIGWTDDGSANFILRWTYNGDANLDGIVNSVDFSALASNFNTSSGWGQGDFNYDGAVNALDFNALASNYGSVLAAPALGSLVPEPATLGFIAMLSLLSRRHRRLRP